MTLKSALTEKSKHISFNQHDKYQTWTY